jgi:hypothetical protein
MDVIYQVEIFAGEEKGVFYLKAPEGEDIAPTYETADIRKAYELNYCYWEHGKPDVDPATLTIGRVSIADDKLKYGCFNNDKIQWQIQP